MSIKNTNIRWHNQSKFINWCMICEKKIQTNASAFHYKTHHGENYISRLAPVLLQQFKQGKLNRPLFGVDKTPKRSSWFFRCPFCLKYFNTPLLLWLEHFRNHTTEFNYECSKCHTCNNRQATIRRHIQSKCKGATLINSRLKLAVPTLIKAHVCHFCNFLQLKRSNLDRHYSEQHRLDKKTAELLGYTITLFDVKNVQRVPEMKAAEREKQAWESIQNEEQIIDITDDEEEESKEGRKTGRGSIKKEIDTAKRTENQKENEQRVTPNEKSEKSSKHCEIRKENDETAKMLDSQSKVDEPSSEKIETHRVSQSKDDSETPREEENESQQKDKPKLKGVAQAISEPLTDNVTDNLRLTTKHSIAKEIATEKDNNETTKTLELENLKAKDTQTDSPPKAATTKDGDGDEDEKQNKKKANNNDCEIINAEEAAAQDLQDELLALAAEKEAEKLKSKEKLFHDPKATTKDENKTYNNDFEIVNAEETAQDLQDELLALAAKAAEKENEVPTTPIESTKAKSVQVQSTMSDIISSSIDMIYNRHKRKSTENDFVVAAKKPCQVASNVFITTRDENNSSPTIQTLAQSIITIEEEAMQTKNSNEKSVTISMAERLSQRFKGLQNEASTPKNDTVTETHSYTKTYENPFEKLLNDTVLELELEKEKEKEKEKESCYNQIPITNEEINSASPVSQLTDVITVTSDDEDWEDIEITETAPATSSAINSGNIQKSKNKGLFQKFGIFKGSNTKSKKHLTPMVFLPKKKTKEKPLQTLTTPSSPTPSSSTIKLINTSSLSSSATATTNSNAHLGFKPVINIMDDLLPDSPCNDPIDLVPELAPLEPLKDLNDISSILDSNLSAINVDDHHTSIEDALDFISEQQANDQLKANVCSSLKSSGKTIINNIAHVGYSVQSTGENVFKFYCLLQNCSFLYSSDAIGLETHFMCEHSQIKWNGYCLMCQSQCFPNADAALEHSIAKEIKHMLDKHVEKPKLDFNIDSTQHSTTSSQGSEERPKIKLRRMTGDCLSTATSDTLATIATIDIEDDSIIPTNSIAAPMSMLGALLVAKPKPPTIEMPPQPQMPLTEPLLLGNSVVSETPFKTVSSDFMITSVTSVSSLGKENPQQMHLPKITSARTLAPKAAGNLWSQQVEEERQELLESAAESLEVSRILANAGKLSSTRREANRVMDDSPGPVVVSETVPLAQSKTGDFVITQTVSAQYDEFSSTALGINISIAPTALVAPPPDKTNQETLPAAGLTAPILTSRQYKCMANGCKFVSRVRVAMSDHLRFHERRNLSNKRDYFACGFCFHHAADVDEYMRHADQYHIINKGDTATSLTKKIHDILNSNSNTSGPSQNANTALQNQTTQTPQDTQEVYEKKLRETIDEIVGPTGLPDDKLYRCVVKNCRTQLTENTFLSHIMYHITASGGNPNNYSFKCPHCPALYQRVAGIKAHIKNHARNRYFCYLCDETSTNPGQLLKHFSDKHWQTSTMYTRELLKPKTSSDGSENILDSGYFIAYTQELSDEEVKKFGEKLILEWQRKKSGSKTHFKSSEIDLLPLSAIFQRQVNCGECEYKTKVRTNMFRHLQMHKQNPGSIHQSGVSNVYIVDPVNPVPCLNSTERFFDKMTNLASSSLIPSSSSTANAGNSSKSTFKIPYTYVEEAKRFTCGSCNYLSISEDIFRSHLSMQHSSALTYRCIFCQEEICKRGITIDRIMNHLRFHGNTIYRCEECNYVHHMRYVVERHINERHVTLKVNIVTHDRSSEDSVEGNTSTLPYAGKKYKETLDSNAQVQNSATTTRSANSDAAAAAAITKASSLSANGGNKGKGKWVCDACGHRASTVVQIQTHCQQLHGVKNQYKCAHCTFGSQQLSQILFHIDEKHSGKTREARYMYHKSVNFNDEVADTRPLWQRNDPTRVRHIRGILMEDEDESEEYRTKLGLTEDNDNDGDGDGDIDGNGDGNDIEEPDEELHVTRVSYISGYEFACFHCDFKTEIFEDLKTKHYANMHNCQLEMAKPFWYRLHMRLACPECRTFVGNAPQIQQHLRIVHKKYRFYAADLTMAENEDSSQRILCGHCSFHSANAGQLHRHYLRVHHLPQDIHIKNDEHIMDILSLNQPQISYQCTLCADIFSNSVAIVQHACNDHGGEDSFSFRELSNSLIYLCVACSFTSTSEMDLLRHMIDHYRRFQICHFCTAEQTSFNGYMQHCYAEHRTEIQKFKHLYPLFEVKKFLLLMLIVFPSGLVVNKRNLLNTKYGKTDAIRDFYEEIYKISQQPPIPKLSIARLVARKSIEAQQKQRDSSLSPQAMLTETDLIELQQPQAKSIPKRRYSVAISRDDNAQSIIKPKLMAIAAKPAIISKRRTTVDHENTPLQNTQFSLPLQPKMISKRRRTVAVDRETSFFSHLSSSPHSLLVVDSEVSCKKRKFSPPHRHEPTTTTTTPLHYPLNIDMEPFSFYGKAKACQENIDLSKVFTKVAIGGIKTPLTIDKFKLLFNIECQLKLEKCDHHTQMLTYNNYKHIKRACPASHKLQFK